MAPPDGYVAELLGTQPASCRLWPEQTEGPYHRPRHPERGDITEDRVGLPLRIGLRAVHAGPRRGRYLEVGATRDRGSVGDLPARDTAHRRPGDLRLRDDLPGLVRKPDGSHP